MDFANIKRLWWEVVVGLCIVIFVIAAAIKLFSGEIRFSVDAPTLLSILLALFSVALSALFYFKATESSSMFYDNTYKYTTDIAQLLVKMESSFGEKLKVLETGYADIKVYLRTPANISSELEEATAQIKIEKEALEKAVQEKDKMIKNVLENSSIEQAQKDQFYKELEQKNIVIRQLTEEMTRLNELKDSELARRNLPSGVVFEGEMNPEFGVPNIVLQHTKAYVLKKLGGASVVMKMSVRAIIDEFSRASGGFNPSYLHDLDRLGFLEGRELTFDGAKFIRSVARASIQV